MCRTCSRKNGMGPSMKKRGQKIEKKRDKSTEKEMSNPLPPSFLHIFHPFRQFKDYNF